MEASPNVSNEAVRVLSSRKAMVRAAMERSRNDSPRLVRLEMTLNSSSGTTMAPMTCDQTAPKRETYGVSPREYADEDAGDGGDGDARAEPGLVRALQRPQENEYGESGGERRPVDEWG